MGCGTKIVQYLFFAFNFLFFVLGMAVLGFGIYSRVENDSWRDLIDSDTIMQAANLLIASGIIVAFIGFLGCCGACKRWQWMLILYAVVVILIFILEIAAGIYAYVKRDSIEKSLTNKLTSGINVNYGKTDTASVGLTKAIDYFQETVKCCGTTGPESWKTSHWRSSQGQVGKKMVPKSCCKSQTAGCGTVTNYNSATIYQGGCITEGKNYAKDNLWLIGGIGVGIAVVQLLGIIFSICLCRSYKAEEGGSSA